MTSVEAIRIGGATFYKLLLIGMVSAHVVITLSVMVLVLLGVMPIEAEKPPIPISLGILGAYLLVGIVAAPLWVGVFWLGIWPGLWIYSLVRPVRLRYHALAADADDG
ncbi:MAG: hypothetical protein P8Y95_16320 [Gammaproteobacteria bacterium]|jgi:hypothetical protein